jgi:hypothetical protein
MRPGEPAAMPPPARPTTVHTVGPGAGHDVHLDEPRAPYDAIGSFLETLA